MPFQRLSDRGSSSPMTTIAFLGTGTMGLPMARHLLRKGFDVRAWNRTSDRARPLGADGGTICDDPRAAAEGADIVITMLSDAPTVLDVAGAALDGAPSGTLWLQMSTIGLEGMTRCLDLAQKVGVACFDAPVLGTRQPAEDAKLVILASGPDDARERVQPIFDAVGQRTIWLGEAGAASRCKVVINSWIVGVVNVLAETIAAARALGVDPQQFFDALEGGALDLPYARIKGAAMMARDFDDASFRLALARKDADLVLAAASDADLDLPVMSAIADRMRRAEDDGHGDEDMAATYWVTDPQHG
jgi:3-hydroxyisobutyrate dehydrogenase